MNKKLEQIYDIIDIIECELEVLKEYSKSIQEQILSIENNLNNIQIFIIKNLKKKNYNKNKKNDKI